MFSTSEIGRRRGWREEAVKGDEGQGEGGGVGEGMTKGGTHLMFGVT